MPCGGIYEQSKELPEAERSSFDLCSECGLYLDASGVWPSLYVEEWDGLMVHKSCLVEYLKSEEGGLVREHRHGLYFSTATLFDDGGLWPSDWELQVKAIVVLA